MATITDILHRKDKKTVCPDCGHDKRVHRIALPKPGCLRCDCINQMLSPKEDSNEPND
jgi:ribosomal protein L37AE/L43A